MNRSEKVKEEEALNLIWEKLCMQELIKQCCKETAEELYGY